MSEEVSKKQAERYSEDAVVTLLLEVEHDDRWLYFERPAPALPNCVQWHKGLWVDFGDEEGGALVVEAVYVRMNGTVQVVFEERYHSNANEQSVKDFTDFGWQVSST